MRLVGIDQVQDFLDWVVKEAGRLPFSAAMPVAIPEPDKVRIITKASATFQYLTLCLQKFMHTTVSGRPSFEFIGKPIDE